MDVDTLQPGVNFLEAIEECVAACDLVLALIGDEWLTLTDSGGNRRLDNPDDFIRVELTAALSRNVPLIPVLVAGATMPSPSDLPPELSRLAGINALEISDNRWDYDVGRLISALNSAGLRGRPAFPGASQDDFGRGPKLRDKRRKWAKVGLLISLSVVVVVGIFVSTRPRATVAVPVPNCVVGPVVEERCTELLLNADLVPVVSREPSGTAVIDVVLRTDPVPGTYLRHGSQVLVTVSDGLKIPADFVGRREQEVVDILRALGLEPSVAREDHGKAGLVARTLPPSGTVVRSGDVVQVVVSNGV